MKIYLIIGYFILNNICISQSIDSLNAILFSNVNESSEKILIDSILKKDYTYTYVYVYKNQPNINNALAYLTKIRASNYFTDTLDLLNSYYKYLNIFQNIWDVGEARNSDFRNGYYQIILDFQKTIIKTWLDRKFKDDIKSKYNYIKSYIEIKHFMIFYNIYLSERKNGSYYRSSRNEWEKKFDTTQIFKAAKYDSIKSVLPKLNSLLLNNFDDGIIFDELILEYLDSFKNYIYNDLESINLKLNTFESDEYYFIYTLIYYIPKCNNLVILNEISNSISKNLDNLAPIGTKFYELLSLVIDSALENKLYYYLLNNISEDDWKFVNVLSVNEKGLLAANRIGFRLLMKNNYTNRTKALSLINLDDESNIKKLRSIAKKETDKKIKTEILVKVKNAYLSE